jgi:D-glycero-D-manno-heptose 1,7-bisphosphate phosphatase
MSHEPRPAVFLDRDGVINRNFLRGGVTCPPLTPEEFEFLPGVIESAGRLSGAGFVLVVVSNQPDVARGSATREGVERLNDLVRAALPVEDVLCCFHDRGDGCACRKPLPGLLLEAARRWRLDLGRSFMVGDRHTDVLAGQAAGCRTVLVESASAGAGESLPDHRAADLAAAAEWILSQPSCRGEA